MASAELQRLWKLQQIDAALQDVRNKAAHLDVGQRIQAEIDTIAKELEAVAAESHTLSAELKDLELANATLDDKLKKIDKQLYGGLIISPREVQNLEKEIEILKRQRSGNDARILELWDLVPPAKEKADKVQARLDEAKGRLAERRKAALQDKKLLETEYARLTALRPDASKGISPTLLARYEDIRKKHHGVGMAEATKKSTCSACGMSLPVRVIAALKEDKVLTCEGCHRILYYTEGLV